MSILIHFITSIILALFLFQYFRWYSMLVFIGGVLIDIDHYFEYIMRFRKINFFKGYSYFSCRDHFDVFCIFHSFELFLVLLIASFFSEVIWIVTVGFFFHYILDFIHELKTAGRLMKIWLMINWLRRRF